MVTNNIYRMFEVLRIRHPVSSILTRNLKTKKEYIMFKNTKAFSGFSVGNIEKAKEFYGETLGLKVTDGAMGTLALHVAGGTRIMIYPKPDHEPATFTILNFPVDDIDAAIDALKEKGVQFEHYDNDDLPQDEKGVLRGLSAGMGPDIAWFTDPAGNILSILQEAD